MILTNMSGGKAYWFGQYEILIKFLSDESNRFWTRFQVSLIINGSLIVAFSALLGYILNKSSSLGIASLIAVCIMGIVFSGLWISIIRTNRSWQQFWVVRVQELEKKHESELEINMMPSKKGEIRGSVTKASFGYPITFLIFWISFLSYVVWLSANLPKS